MARRYTGNMNGEQYLGNANKTEVDDLDNEKTGHGLTTRNFDFVEVRRCEQSH